MKQALLNLGWHQEENFIKDEFLYYKVISTPKFCIWLKYDIVTKWLTVKIRCRANNYVQSTIMTCESMRDCYGFAIKEFSNIIRTLPTIECAG